MTRKHCIFVVELMENLSSYQDWLQSSKDRIFQQKKPTNCKLKCSAVIEIVMNKQTNFSNKEFCCYRDSNEQTFQINLL